MLPSVVSFDLTGTLLRPFPSLGALCVEAMRAQGIAEIPPAAEFDARRTQARLAAQAKGDAPVSEARSRRYWRDMLWEIFAGRCSNAQFDRAVAFIYDALSRPEHWAMMPAVVPALEAIRFLGVRLVVLSNGDSRWRKALADKKILPFFDRVFLSSETGFAKPSEAAFDNLCREMKIERGELLHVGDTLGEDIVPAVNFGARAVWVAPRATALPPENVPYFETLADVPAWIRARLVAGFAWKKPPRSAQNLVASLRGLPPQDLAPRKYRELDREKEVRISSKFVRESEERRERGDDEPRDVAPFFEKLLRSRGFFEHSLQARILRDWAELVPARLAERTSPLALEDSFSRLKVHCANAVVRAEFEFEKTAVLRRLRALPGGEKIRSLVLVV